MITKTPLNSRLNLATLAAGIGAVGATQSASGAIVSYDISSSPLGVNSSVNSIYIDVDGGLSSNTTVLPGADFSLGFAGGAFKPVAVQYASGTKFSLSGSYVSKLNFGDLISASSNNPSGTNNLLAQLSNGPWAAGGPSVADQGYVGFSFEPASTVLYGWANVTYNGPTFGPSSLELDGWAYDNSGAGITAGDTGTPIPEPGETAMIAAVLAGSAALFARRRRKAA